MIDYKVQDWPAGKSLEPVTLDVDFLHEVESDVLRRVLACEESKDFCTVRVKVDVEIARIVDLPQGSSASQWKMNIEKKSEE